MKDLSSLSGLLLLMAVPDYHPPVVFEIAHQSRVVHVLALDDAQYEPHNGYKQLVNSHIHRYYHV